MKAVVHSVGGALGGLAGAAWGLLGKAVGKAAGVASSSLLNDAASWVGRGAVYVLDGLGHLMSASTTPQVGSHYFMQEFGVLAVAGATVAVPLLLLTAVQAVVQQDAGVLLRAVLVRVPLAMVLTGVVVQLVSLGLAATDSMSAAMLHVAGVPTGRLFADLGKVLTVATSGVVPAFAGFAVGSAVAASAITLWLELCLRSAALEAATLFLPLALAGVIWPATSHWARRLGETIAALILSKLVIVGVLALAAGQLVAQGGGGFAAVMSGIALLMLALLSPFALFRIVPMIEAGAVGHFESLRLGTAGSQAGQAATAGIKGLLNSSSPQGGGASQGSPGVPPSTPGEIAPLPPPGPGESGVGLSPQGLQWNGEPMPDAGGASGGSGGGGAAGGGSGGLGGSPSGGLSGGGTGGRPGGLGGGAATAGGHGVGAAMAGPAAAGGTAAGAAGGACAGGAGASVAAGATPGSGVTTGTAGGARASAASSAGGASAPRPEGAAASAGGGASGGSAGAGGDTERVE